jgi:hypothetical protein
MWLHEEFRKCPLGADEPTVTLYARAWVWHIFATVLFPHSTGDVASWMYILALVDWNEAGSYNWGSTVLVYLYHHLCDAYRRRGNNAGFGGCVYFLHVSLTTTIYFLVHLHSNSDDTCYLYLFCRFGW